MTKKDEIRCSECVNHPYKLVRNALTENAKTVFENATKGAASNANGIAAELRATIAGVEVAKEIAISVTNIDQSARAPKSSTATCFHLEWEATHLPRLFPLMQAKLLVWPLSGTETQLDFVGFYKPPGGALGSAIDSIAGHQIAAASVKQFVQDVATYLGTALARKPIDTQKT